MKIRKLLRNLSQFVPWNQKYRCYGLYRRALVRSIDDSLVKYALRQDSMNKNNIVDIVETRRQHETYVNVLTSLDIDVHILPSNGYPDSVFIEDTVVTIDDTIMITNPGAITRKNEVHAVREYLLHSSKENLFRKLYRICDLGGGTLDGGDVLFTGNEIFVGKSHRTNLMGIESLSRIFGKKYPIYMIDLQHLQPSNPVLSSISSAVKPNIRPLHLKTMCSMVCTNHIIFGGNYATSLKEMMLSKVPSLDHRIVLEEGMANCLFVNNTIIRRCDWEYPNSVSVFKQPPLNQYHQIQVPNSELAKVDGALTCCSILLAL